MSVGRWTAINIIIKHMCFAVLENVVFDEHNREVDYSEKSVTGKDHP